jgi:hypothetical protein
VRNSATPQLSDFVQLLPNQTTCFLPCIGFIFNMSKSTSPDSNASSVYEDEYMASPPASFTADLEQLAEEEDSSSSSHSVRDSPKIKFQRLDRSFNNNSLRRLSISKKGKLERTEGSRWQKDFTTIGKRNSFRDLWLK